MAPTCQRVAGILALLTLLTPGMAEAAGFWTLGRGASNFARGGANIADPRDPSALYLNPAALPALRGLQFMVDGNWVFDARQFTRAPDDLERTGTATEYDTVKNGWGPTLPSPGGFLTYNFASLGLEQLTLGLGVFGPQLADREFPTDGPQRYTEIESHNLQIHYSFGAGYELPWLGLRIGATGMMVSQIIDVTLRLNVTGLAVPENELYDAEVGVEASEDYIPLGVLAISAAPLPQLRLSLAYQLPYDVAAEGTAAVDFQRGIGSIATVSGDAVDVQLKMPALFRAAALYRHPDDSFEVELAFQWEGWSRNDEILFVPQDITVDVTGNVIELGNIPIGVHARDTGSVRLGGQYRVLPELLTIRAGGFYERAAVGGGWLNPAMFDLDKIGGSLGARVELPFSRWFGGPVDGWLDLAGGYAHWMEKTVDTSKVLLSNPLAEEGSPEAGICANIGGEDVPCWPTANGTYSNSVFTMMAALGINVDI